MKNPEPFIDLELISPPIASCPLLLEDLSPLREAAADTSKLSRFSHTPPKGIKGHRRWPLSLEAQAFPDNRLLVLMDVLEHTVFCHFPLLSLVPVINY